MAQPVSPKVAKPANRSTWENAGLDIDAVAERLMLIRLAKGMKKATFARHAGIWPNLYGQFENRKRPLTIGAALQIRAAHNVSLDYIYEGQIDALPRDLADKIADLRRKGAHLSDS